MTLLEYLKDYLPIFFGVNPIFGKVTELVFQAEQIDNKLFGNDLFTSLRERAALGMPYQVDNIEKREHVLNVLEIILCIHRQKFHDEDYQQRIDELKAITNFTVDEAKLIVDTEGWWDG